jgi:hypothetical protein
MTNKNGSGSVLLWLITIALIAFTASRSVHLIQFTLPADSQMLAYAALAGLDGGVLAWLFWTTRSAQGGVQRTIGTLMIIVDLCGIAAAVLGDTMLVADEGSKALVGMVAVWIVPLVIVANIVACVVAHIFDPQQAIRDAERAVTDELQRQKAEYMRANAASIAAEVAHQAGQHAAREMVAGFQSAHRNGHEAATFAEDGDDGVSLGKSRRRK